MRCERLLSAAVRGAELVGTLAELVERGLEFCHLRALHLLHRAAVRRRAPTLLLDGREFCAQLLVLAAQCVAHFLVLPESALALLVEGLPIDLKQLKSLLQVQKLSRRVHVGGASLQLLAVERFVTTYKGDLQCVHI